jgi:hypothetical protein
MSHLESFVRRFRPPRINRASASAGNSFSAACSLMFAVKAFAQPLSLWLHQRIKRNRVRTVGGGVELAQAQLTKQSGGSGRQNILPPPDYNFSGHVHDSGIPSFDYSVVWLVVATSMPAPNQQAFSFQKSGRLHGTFEKGSRDDDWNIQDTNPTIRDAWAAAPLVIAGNAIGALIWMLRSSSMP